MDVPVLQPQRHDDRVPGRAHLRGARILGLGSSEHKETHHRTSTFAYTLTKYDGFVVSSETSSVTSRREVTVDEDAPCKPQTLGCKIFDQ